MYTVTIHDRQLTAGHGERLSDVLRRAGISFSMICGGRGTCGKCTVLVNGKKQLACQTYVTENMDVVLPNDDMQIAAHGIRREVKMYETGYGAAVDIGTTTVAAYAVDLSDGRILRTVTALNEQRRYGADVISRITYCMEHSDGTQELSRVIGSQVGDMIKEAVQGKPIKKAVIAGNTVMEHIFLGETPVGLAAAPFMPIFLNGREVVFHDIATYVMPCVSAYIGGDILSAMLACSMDMTNDTCLLLDIGTNGEMVLKKDNRYYCCSAAAGPAFEGGHISCGTGSVSGAVCAVRFSNGLIYADTIGRQPSAGICGSGLLDAITELLNEQIIDHTGRILPYNMQKPEWRRYVASDASKITLTSSVFLTQKDIREFQMAKSAVRAGIETLLQCAEASYDDVRCVFLAGGMGTHISAKSACAVGMLPRQWENKTCAVGNVAGSGAVSVLLDGTLRDTAEQIRQAAQIIALADSSVFEQAYLKYMDFI